MNEEELARALEPFRQVKRPGRNEHKGTGLGLPLTKALAEANRAEFSIRSEPENGTLVEITFPTTRVLAD
jgi:signal transduction histidine kinase